jgi:amino acid transporter
MSTRTDEPTLLPRLGLWGLVFFGLAYMGPNVVVATFGIVSLGSGGAAPLAYLSATVAMTFTAISYAVLSREYPTSGSAYTYVGALLGRVTGFFAGWVILLDYLFLPMVLWLIVSTYMNAQYPSVPIWVWLVTVITATTAVNLLGLALAEKVNTFFLMVTLAAVAALVIVMVAHLGHHGGGDMGRAMWPSHTPLGQLGSAAGIAAYSFLGFDAISTLAEETRDPRRNIPRGIILTVLAGGAIFFVVALLMQMVHPGSSFHDPDTAGYQIARMAGGQTFANVRNIFANVAAGAAAIAIQATSSRLLYVIGRDNVLPRSVFGRLSRTFRVPWVNIVLIGAIGLIATRLDIDTATSLINFGAFLAFILVNVSFGVWIWRRRDAPASVARRLAMTVIPVLGALVDLYLFVKLSHVAHVVGLIWLAIGIVVVCFATRGFRRPVPRIVDGSAVAGPDVIT